MKRLALVVVALAVLASLDSRLLAQDPARLFKAAMNTELVDGDPKAAIEQYKKVAASGDRVLAAQALLRMAGCYQKLGDAEAQKIYARLIRDYADQAESAASARTRLSAMRQVPAGGNDISFRRVWAASHHQAGQVSYDGRYIAYQFGSGSIRVRELATSKDHTLVVPQGEKSDGEDPAISRDSKMVAYTWYLPEEGRYELRTIPVQTSSTGQPRRLFRSENVLEPTPFDWSPDGKWIAVHARADGTSQIGLVSTADGSLKVLKSLDWDESKKRRDRWSIMSFSPDGKYLAYDLADSKAGQRDVFVIPVDGGPETAAIAHPSDDTLAAWSPDGKQLLFISDRTGSRGLWSQALVDGRPQGPVALIKADLGESRSMGITASGGLYVFSSVVEVDVEVVPIDFAKGQIVGRPVKPIPDYVGTNSRPEWSSDGRFMSYRSRREGRLVLAMRELATGTVRTIRPQLGTVAAEAWSPDRKFFAVPGIDLKGRDGLFLVNAETGGASPIASTAVVIGPPVWSLDGKKLYYTQRDRMDKSYVVFERDMASGAAREIIRRGSLGPISLSSDGRWMAMATRTVDAAGRFSSVIVFPASGGEVREVMRVSHPIDLSIRHWAPDSGSIIVGRLIRGEPSTSETWQVPISGGEPRNVELKIDSVGGWFRLHPDGRQLAYTREQTKDEVWVLENFLPKTSVNVR